MKKINKTIGIIMLMLIIFTTSSFATGNVSTNTNSSVEAGYTPDNTIMYNFDKFGDWVSLNFAKLEGEQKYNTVENNIIQERLSEFKIVSEKNRAKLQETIKKDIQDRKDRNEKRLEELKQKIKDRKQQLLNSNITSKINDTNLNDFNKQIEQVNNEIKSDDNGIGKKLKQIEQFRNNEVKKLQEKLQKQHFETKDYKKQFDKFKNENPKLVKKYGSLLKDFNGTTFKITTNKREIVGQIVGNNINFKENSENNSNIDYNIKVKSEDDLKKMIENKNYSIKNIDNNVATPLSLKTKIAYELAKLN